MTNETTKKIHVTTNNKARDILTSWDLTDDERKDFDYLPDGEGSFFRYKGRVYDLGEFMVIPEGMEFEGKWSGYQSDSFFSGVVVRYMENFEQVIVGLYCA